MPPMRVGFTLIELLAVTTILSILAAILFPVFSQAKVAARKAGDVGNFKNIALATLQYVDDFDGLFPSAYGRHCTAPRTWVVDGRMAVPYNWDAGDFAHLSDCVNNGVDATGHVWSILSAMESAPNILFPYIKTWVIFDMPGSPTQAGFHDAESGDGNPALVSYTMNGLLSSYTQSAVADPTGTAIWWPGFGQVARIGDTYAVPFLICPDPNQPCTFNPNGVVINNAAVCDAVSKNSNSFLNTGNTLNGTMSGVGSIHHSSFCFGRTENWAFTDGHVKSRQMGTGDPDLDPFPGAGYLNGVPNAAPGYESHNAVFDQFCQTPLFRPDIPHPRL